MKNILTTQQLRKKYDPDSILKGIESHYKKNLDKLLSILSQPDSPLIKYSSNHQISFLESHQKKMILLRRLHHCSKMLFIL